MLCGGLAAFAVLLLSSPQPAPRLPCPSPDLVKQVDATTWSLPREALRAFHARRDCLAREGRGVPVERQGKPWGLELRNVPPGGFVEALGLKNKDVLLRVAGLPVHSLTMALAAYMVVLSAGEAEVELSRGGQERRHRYRLVD